MVFSWNLVSLAVALNAASAVISFPVTFESDPAPVSSTFLTSTTVPPTLPSTIPPITTTSLPSTTSFPTTPIPRRKRSPPTSNVTPTVQINPNGNTTKCLGVQDAVLANGTPVQIFDCNRPPAQQWVISPGQGHVQLANTKFCLDAGASPAAGTGMKIWECIDNAPAQDWYYMDDKTIALTGQGLCLDFSDGDLTNGRQAQIWTCTDDINKVWTTTTAAASPTMPPVAL